MENNIIVIIPCFNIVNNTACTLLANLNLFYLFSSALLLLLLPLLLILLLIVDALCNIYNENCCIV